MLRTIFLIILFCISLFSRTFDEIKDSKVLKVAMRENGMTYDLVADKIIPNFDYALALEFAKYLGVKIEIVKVDSFKDFWLKDGKFIFALPAPATPDIFKKADMTLDIISVNESRKKYVTMVPYVKNKSIIYTNKNKQIKNIEDLIGKKVLLFEGMQSEIILRKIFKDKNIPIKTFSTSFMKKQNKFTLPKDSEIDENSVNLMLINRKDKMPFLSIYLAVYHNDADVSSTDSFSLFQKLQRYSYLKDDLVPAFTIDKKMGYLSGTMPKKSIQLAKEFRKFLKEAKANGIFDSLMLKYFSVDLKTYNQIVEHNEN